MTDIKKEAGPESRSIVNRVTEFLNPMELARRTLSDNYRELSDLVRSVDNDLREKACSKISRSFL